MHLLQVTVALVKQRCTCKFHALRSELITSMILISGPKKYGMIKWAISASKYL